MKRIVVLLFVLLSVPALSFGQTSVSSGSPNLDVTVKRAIAEGDDVIIDLLLTSRSSWKKVIFSTSLSYPSCRLYDDEGNLYQSGESSRMMFESDGKRTYWFPELVVENGIARKMRVIVKNVDEYATEFTKAYFHYYVNGVDFVENELIITVKNLPITR